jgi:hypothetical protein
MMLDRIAQAKAQCGGVDCIIAGGFLDSNPCDRPLDHFLAALPNPTVVQELPDKNLAKDNRRQPPIR